MRLISLRRLTITALVALAGLIAAPIAHAQLPPLPEAPGAPAPEVPAPVQEQIDYANDTVVPLLVSAGSSAQPATNAGGFALRPACLQGTTVTLAFGLAGLPVDPSIVTKPIYAFCAGSQTAGPADPYFAQVDAAVGPQLEEGAEPALVAANPVVEQVRPEISLLCVAMVLLVPGGFPPPLHRFSPTREVCWR